jgi:hypothetical protein
MSALALVCQTVRERPLIIVGQFFSGFDVALSHAPPVSPDLGELAVSVARMVNVSAWVSPLRAAIYVLRLAVLNDVLCTVSQPIFGFPARNLWAFVFLDLGALWDVNGGEQSPAIDRRAFLYP